MPKTAKIQNHSYLVKLQCVHFGEHVSLFKKHHLNHWIKPFGSKLATVCREVVESRVDFL